MYVYAYACVHILDVTYLLYVKLQSIAIYLCIVCIVKQTCRVGTKIYQAGDTFIKGCDEWYVSN